MPTLASTNRTQLRYIPEVSWGVTPGAGNAINLRMQGESLDFNLSKESDKEIRADRQRVSSTTVNAAAGGAVNVHMQYAEYDKLLASALQEAWAVHGVNGVGTSFSATITTTTITAAVAPTGASAFTTLAGGQWFRLGNTTGLNAGKYFRVSTSVAPTSTVITLDASTPGVAETSVAGYSVQTSRLANGSTMSSFSIERAVEDVVQFMLFKGMSVNKFSTTFNSGALTDASFEFMGKNMSRDVITGLPGTPVASQTYDIQNAVTGVGHVWEGGAPLASTYIKSISLNTDNALRAQDAIMNLGAVGLGTGAFMANGSVEMYFSDGTMYDKFLSDTYTSFTVSTKDTAGNGYVITLPRVMLTSGKVQAGSKDSDLMASFNWEAFADTGNATAALRKTMFIDRVGAAVA